jgi:hypothetical protein
MTKWNDILKTDTDWAHPKPTKDIDFMNENVKKIQKVMKMNSHEVETNHQAILHDPVATSAYLTFVSNLFNKLIREIE